MTLIELRKRFNKKNKDFKIKDYIEFLEKIILGYNQDALCDKIITQDYEYAIYLENKFLDLSWSINKW